MNTTVTNIGEQHVCSALSVYRGLQNADRVPPGPIDSEMFLVWVTIVLAQDVRVCCVETVFPSRFFEYNNRLRFVKVLVRVW